MWAPGRKLSTFISFEIEQITRVLQASESSPENVQIVICTYIMGMVVGSNDVTPEVVGLYPELTRYYRYYYY